MINKKMIFNKTPKKFCDKKNVKEKNRYKN